jgi:hypothetical protein
MGPELKAAGFNSAVNALRVLSTPADFDKMVDALPPETAELVRHPPLAVAWLPNEHFSALIETACRVVFGGDETRIEEVARRAMSLDLKTIYKIFVRLASPQFVVERATKLWQTYTRNNGFATATPTGNAGCEVAYEDIDRPSPVLWAYQRGAIRGVIEATGVKTVRVQVLRGGHTQPHCRFAVTWE